MVSTFRIVLKQEEGFDVHDTREFDLALGSKFAIGRASKNTSKGYLLPAKHNVFIDSPVVSREHAILTANTSTGSPHVFITDTKSMHGTYVNGTPLVPYAPKQLLNGDKLQFGVNVNRNESYFIAYKYTFNAELSDPEPFSRGFTVPEAESEEEELDFFPSGRGSQLNPLVLDDSDAEAEPDFEEHDEHAEHSEDKNDVTMVQLEEDEVVKIVDSSEDDDDDAAAADDVADDVAESDIESDCASTGGAPYTPESPLVHDAQYTEEVEVQVEVPATQQVQPTTTEQIQPSATQLMPLVLPRPEQSPVEPFFADFAYPVIPNLSLPPPPQHANPYLAYGTSSLENTVAPPLPPRPSQKRQRIWDEAPQEEQAWYGGPSLASPTLDRTLFIPETEPTHAPLPVADRIQTPPHTEPIDPAHSTSSPSTCRTGVSITEIVAEQPPTPTSINNLKRSADEAFEEETEEPVGEKAASPEIEGVAPALHTSNVDTPGNLVIPTVEEVAIHPQRPIAQPKGIFRRALRAAKVMVPATALGAVFTVTALTTLPESFFTVA